MQIQRGAKVGERCKISSHTFICSGVTIEDEVFIGQVSMARGSLPVIEQVRPQHQNVVVGKTGPERIGYCCERALVNRPRNYPDVLSPSPPGPSGPHLSSPPWQAREQWGVGCTACR